MTKVVKCSKDRITESCTHNLSTSVTVKLSKMLICINIFRLFFIMFNLILAILSVPIVFLMPFIGMMQSCFQKMLNYLWFLTCICACTYVRDLILFSSSVT